MTKEQKEVIDKFAYCAAKSTNVNKEWIFNEKIRKREMVTARNIVIHLIKTDKRTKSLTLSAIGNLLGGLDHSTIVHSNTKVEEALTPDKNGKFLHNAILRNAFIRTMNIFEQLDGIQIPDDEKQNIFARRGNLIMARKEIEKQLNILNQEVKQYYENYRVDNN